MGIARKCNRCGKCFDPFSTDEIFAQFKNPVFMSKENMTDHTVKSYLIESYSPDAWVDLCPECAELFENFMCGADIPKGNISIDHYRDLMFEADNQITRLADECKKKESEIENLKKINNDISYSRDYWENEADELRHKVSELKDKIDALQNENKDLEKENTRLSAIYYALESGYEKVEKQRDDLEDSLADAESKIEELKILLNVDEYNDEEAHNKLFDKLKKEIMEALYAYDAKSLKSRIIAGFDHALYGREINDMEHCNRGRDECRTRFCDYASGNVKRAEREVPPEQEKQ